MNRNNNIKLLAYTIVLFLILTVGQIIYMQFRISDETKIVPPTAYATGITRLCVNNAPSDIIFGCNTTIAWGINYICKINATDIDAGETFNYTSLFITNQSLFNISTSGAINFTPPKSSEGNHTVRIYANDNSKCDNAEVYKDFNLSIIAADHAPYLAITLPNQTIIKDSSYGFFLNDYFADIDGDSLTYIASSSNANITLITISNSSFVTVKGLACGQNLVYYIATDPYNLTGTSNTVTYTVIGCNNGASANPSTGGGGAGGGGGGAPRECTPSWKCGKWDKCTQNETSELICRDFNVCDINHYVEYQYRNCTYVSDTSSCLESWQCLDWSTCINDTHTRSCIDTKSCGTKINMPPESETCAPIATCFDGIKDGNETGIDCGGECGVCRNTEIPGKVSQNVNVVMIISFILLLAVILTIIIAFRNKIKDAVSSITKRKRKERPIYLKQDQKEKLLQQVYIMQTRFEEEKYDPLFSELILFTRNYFRELLGVERLNKEVLTEELPRLKNKELQKILLDFYVKMSHLEDFKKYNKIHMQSIIDEISHNIYMVGGFTEKDAMVAVKERSADASNDLEKCYVSLSNEYIALEFSEIREAKKLYEHILRNYESMTTSDKHAIYADIMRAYNSINYMSRENYG